MTLMRQQALKRRLKKGLEDRKADWYCRCRATFLRNLLRTMKGARFKGPRQVQDVVVCILYFSGKKI